MSVSELTAAPYRIETYQGVSVVSFFPDVGTSRWTDLERVSGDVLRQLRIDSASAFLVDLSALTTMGSAMVALVIKLWKGAQEHRRLMVVVNSNGLVNEVLKISGLADVWTIVPTREDAIRTLGTVTKPAAESADVLLISLFGWLALAGAILGLINPPPTGSLSGPLLMQGCCAGIAVIAGVVTLRRGRGIWQVAGILQSVAALVVAFSGIWLAR